MIALGTILFSKQAISCLRCFNHINPTFSKFLINFFVVAFTYTEKKHTVPSSSIMMSVMISKCFFAMQQRYMISDPDALESNSNKET